MTKKQASKQANVEQQIKGTFVRLNQKLKESGYELVIRRPITKELVMFDYGLLFTKGSKEVQVYVDEDLQAVIDKLFESNETVLIKSNWLSPDTIAVTVPPEMPVNATGSTESHDTVENIVE